MYTKIRVIHEIVVRNVPLVENVEEQLEIRITDYALEAGLSEVKMCRMIHESNTPNAIGHAILTLANLKDNEKVVNEWKNKVFYGRLLHFEAHRYVVIKFTRNEIEELLEGIDKGAATDSQAGQATQKEPVMQENKLN